MEKLFVNAQQYSNPKKHPTKFFAVRYGNVFGSSGSVIPKFIEQIKNHENITITSKEMTRFSITMEQALDFILKATQLGKGTEIFIPKIKSYSLKQIHEVLSNIAKIENEKVIGIRPGEKLHEILINSDEMRYAWSYEDLYMILSWEFNKNYLETNYPGITKFENITSYSSNNVENLTNDELKKNINDLNLL
tara:strand:- start:80 stop:655 length:576 start_codon:yes stop_codon:yes gene_type:complete